MARPGGPSYTSRDIISAALVRLRSAPRALFTTRHSMLAGRGKLPDHELAAIVAETVPGCRVEYAPGGGPDERCYRVNCEKIDRRSCRDFVRSGPLAKARRNSTMLIGCRAYARRYGRQQLHPPRRRSGSSLEAGSLDSSLRWANSGKTFPTSAQEPSFTTRNSS